MAGAGVVVGNGDDPVAAVMTGVDLAVGTGVTAGVDAGTGDGE